MPFNPNLADYSKIAFSLCAQVWRWSGTGKKSEVQQRRRPYWTHRARACSGPEVLSHLTYGRQILPPVDGRSLQHRLSSGSVSKTI